MAERRRRLPFCRHRRQNLVDGAGPAGGRPQGQGQGRRNHPMAQVCITILDADSYQAYVLDTIGRGQRHKEPTTR